MYWERRGAGRDVNDQRTCTRAKNQLGKDVRAKLWVKGAQGSGRWFLRLRAFRGLGACWGERIQNSGRGTVGQGLRELTSKTET